jgi:uncharacterized protein (UPF0332 family)
MTRENAIVNAQNELAVARDASRVARAALELGIARDALSRAYYSAFHAARALLLLDGIEPKTHSGVLGMFSAHWVKTGRMESAQVLVLTRLQSYRLASDYAYSFDVQPGDVQGELDAAERFVALAAALVAAAGA